MGTTKPSTPVPTLSEVWSRSGEAPIWVAVALYAAAHADPATGIAHLRARELREAVAPLATPDAISRAIRRAVAAGWLMPESSAWCLRLARPDTMSLTA